MTQAFLDRLQARFGYRLGAWSRPGRRLAYPLNLLLTRNPVRQRLVLIGNAAHTLHPVAGQGLNLGLRDLAALAQIVTDRVRAGADPGAPEALAAYQACGATTRTGRAWRRIFSPISSSTPGRPCAWAVTWDSWPWICCRGPAIASPSVSWAPPGICPGWPEVCPYENTGFRM
jgi:hypothetical protein